VKRQSDLPAASNGVKRRVVGKQKWVEPVTAVLMALPTLSTATGVFFVVVSRLFSNRFRLKTW
jgi:hypothetical protein